METLDDIISELELYVNEEKKEIFPRFFKTGPGQYGEGDKFLGIVVPNVRKVAKQHKDSSLEVVKELLSSPWHECRLCALLILVEKYKKANASQKEIIFDFYLDNTTNINNWDLVDLSAPYIIGQHLIDKDKTSLYTLAKSKNLWEKRISIVATLMLIRHERYDDTINLAELFISQPGPMHDLMQKATGWMLREIGKKDKSCLIAFLDKHSTAMPRTMLRYSIEKLSEDERKFYMKRGPAIRRL